MDRRKMVRYVVRNHIVSWLLALIVLGGIYFLGLGQAPSWPVLLVIAFALLVVTPLLYFLARRSLDGQE